jgi:thiol:disulfide interchange protein DsbA
MPLNRRTVVFAAALSPVIVHAQSGLRPGTFRELNPPQPVETGARIEVLEFFQYSCPHCAAFEPKLAPWRKTLPADVEYRRSPVAFNPGTAPHSRIYYTLEQLKKLDLMHTRVFDAYHNERKRLLDENEIADFMAASGIDRKEWLDNYRSFTVNTRTGRAVQTWRAYAIDGTPAVGIDGKFVTAPSMAGGHEQALAVIDALIARARKERKG